MKNTAALLGALGIFALLLLDAGTMTDSCRCALRLCGELIVPSLFPFFVLSALLNRLGLPSLLGRLLFPAASRLYGVTGAGASALVIGLTGGYPMGAAYIADMEKSGAVTVREAERLLAFCNNSGPAFIIGAVGVGVFRSASAGLLLYAVHILSALLTGLFFRGRDYCREDQPLLLSQVELSSALPEAVSQAVDSVLRVCGFVVCFTVLSELLDSFGHVSLLCGRLSALTGLELRFCRALLTGALELGSGVGAMQGLSHSPLNLALAAVMLGFGGVSVHFQTKAVLSGSKIKGVLHFAGRLISASIAGVLAYTLGPIFL